MPVDEENKRGGRNPPNWHVSISTEEKLAATRFLTVIEVVPDANLGTNPEDRDGGRRPPDAATSDYAVTANSTLQAVAVGGSRPGGDALVTGQAGGVRLAAATRNA
ncbi:MAG: hypothetical protein U1G05_02040 [Kiritimatiellia bacterium]